MGKKGKKAAKQTAGDSGGGAKKKVGPGKARRERAEPRPEMPKRTSVQAPWRWCKFEQWLLVVDDLQTALDQFAAIAGEFKE